MRRSLLLLGLLPKLLFASSSSDSEATLLSTASSQDVQGRIIGGTDANESDYPWFAKLTIPSSQDLFASVSLCGGSLIHSDIVLTAAHCFADSAFTGTTVVVNGYHRNAVSITIHPNYYAHTFGNDNDVAILKLDAPVTQLSPIMLNDDTNSPQDGQSLDVIGYGLLEELTDNNNVPNFPDTLQIVTLNSVNLEVCIEQNSPGNVVTDTNVCAAAPGKDSCGGDSGGPLFIPGSNEQVGIVSNGIGCAREGFPGVYVRVSSYIDFISSAVCESSVDPPTSCGPTDATSGACIDSPPGWVDRDGDGCSWYAQDRRCSQFGDSFANIQGETANTACCVCGGGSSQDSSGPPSTQPLIPTPGPTSQPTSEPTPSPIRPPTMRPTSEPTPAPTSFPSVRPTGEPTPAPTSLTSPPTHIVADNGCPGSDCFVHPVAGCICRIDDPFLRGDRPVRKERDRERLDSRKRLRRDRRPRGGVL